MDHESAAFSLRAPPLRQNRLLSPLFTKKVPPVPQDHERHTYPLYGNPILWFFFTWLWPVMITGYKRTLEPDDLYKLNDKLKADALAARFEAIFARRLAEDKRRHLDQTLDSSKILNSSKNLLNSPDLDDLADLADYVPSDTLCLWSLFETFKWQYLTACFLCALAQVGWTCNPLLSKKLIAYVQRKALGIELDTGKGVGYALGVSLVVFCSDILFNQMYYLSSLTGAELKAIFTKVMLDKSFRLNARSRRVYPVSKITSIMSTDVSRIDLGLATAPMIIVAPVPLAISIGILIHNLKAPALLGIGIMILFLGFAGFLGSLLFKYRKLATTQTDARVSYMKEVLNNLKMIKFYSWEKPYMAMIKAVREKEMTFLLKMQVTRSIIISVAVSLSLVASFASFMLLYGTASASKRNPASIFSSVALFNILALVFINLPLAIAGATDAYIGMRRVGQYLASDEHVEDKKRVTSETDRQLMEEKNLAITVSNANFEWEIFDIPDEEKIKEEKKKQKDKEKNDKKNKKKKLSLDESSHEAVTQLEKPTSAATFKLRNIDLTIMKGEFVVVTGLIGSGKSSLLLALEGSMKRNSGQVKTNGSLLMCGAPWIQSSTIRENVIFNNPYNKSWYEQVIDVCCMDSDLEILPAGDQTEIGERGITLSGGQKARLSLARAVYARSDIILLDDVLSAVDAKVGKRIVDECILGVLRKKTVVLATHQLSLIESADKIVFLNGDGTVDVGTSESLRRSNEAFQKLLSHSTTEKYAEEESSISSQTDESIKKVVVEAQISRLTSVSSTNEKTDLQKQNEGKLIMEEEKSVNAINADVYVRYIFAGIPGVKGAMIFAAVIIFSILSVFFNLFTSTWLSFWVEYKWRNRSDGFYIGFYAAFTVLALVTLTFGFLGVIYVMNLSSRTLNIRAAERILYVPMSYMNVTPMGRIINRFTKDTDVLDNEMGDRMGMIIYFASIIGGVLILCIIYLPWFAIAVPFLIVVFFGFANFYQASGREIKRLEAVQRSLVYNNFNETLTGLDTIRGYDKTDVFLSKNIRLIDKMNEAYFITVANQRWLDVAVSFLATIFAIIISFLCVFRVFKINASSVGLLLSNTLQISGIITTLVVVYTRVEQDMNSAERIIEYVDDLPQEAPYTISETTPNPSWPQQGQIDFNHVNLAYRPGLPMVLKDFTVHIDPNEKIGICGRTGAGKSSIMVALYRMVELTSGNITIDGIDIRTLGLNNLRSKLSIIPQDPVLFQGTIRKNLDPFGLATDEQLWETLRRARIIKSEDLNEVKSQTDPNKMHKFHLDRDVDVDGENFSLGEKQLIAFARALVRGSKILILDEATSSVDYATDKILQEAIVEEFSDCTILCIAHRLKTILNYDRVMVMDQGQVVEFDKPINLFKKQGTFFQMCEKAGINEKEFGH